MIKELNEAAIRAYCLWDCWMLIFVVVVVVAVTAGEHGKASDQIMLVHMTPCICSSTL